VAFVALLFVQSQASVNPPTDVLTFRTAPLQRVMATAGRVQITSHAESDASSSDVCWTLSRATAGGQVFPLSEACCRIGAHEPASNHARTARHMGDDQAGRAVAAVDLRCVVSDALHQARLRRRFNEDSDHAGGGHHPGIRYDAPFPSIPALGTTETIVLD